MSRDKVHVAGRVLYKDDMYVVQISNLKALKGVVNQVPKGLALVHVVKDVGTNVEVVVTASDPLPAVKAGTVCLVPARKLKALAGKGRYKEVARMLEAAKIPAPTRKWVAPSVGRYTLQEAAVMLGLEVSSIKYYMRKLDKKLIYDISEGRLVPFIRYDVLTALHDNCCPPDGYLRIPAAIRLTGLSRSMLENLAVKGHVDTAVIPLGGMSAFNMNDLLTVLRNNADNGASIYKRQSSVKKPVVREIVFKVNKDATLGDLVDLMADSEHINNTLKGKTFTVRVYETEDEKQ